MDRSRVISSVMEANLSDYINSLDRPLSEWVFGLGAWGKEYLVRAAWSVAREVLPIWEGYANGNVWIQRVLLDSDPRKGLSIVERWISDPNPAHLQDAQECATTLRQILEAFWFNFDEGSSSSSTEQAILSFEALYHAVSAAAWTPEMAASEALPGDVAEAEARAAAGPAFDATQAATCARLALNATSEHVYEIIRKTLTAS
jgi:hypothetical protein